MPGCRVTEDDSPETIGEAVRELLLSGEAPGGRDAVSALRLEAVAERVRGIYEEALHGASRQGSADAPTLRT